MVGTNLMPAKNPRRTVSFSVAQIEVLNKRLPQIQDKSLGSYIRRLIAEDFKRSGLEFPDDLNTWGRYSEKKES